MTGIFGKLADEIKGGVRKADVKVCIVGFGYVGLCLGIMLAEKGIKVRGIDVRQEVARNTNAGKSHVVEPDVPELLKRFVNEGKITAYSDYSPIKESDVILVTVGTPLGEDYKPYMGDVSAAAQEIGKLLQKGQMVILKSTVPPGVTEEVFLPNIEKTSGLKAGRDFGLAFCPERLAEGKALKEIRSLPIVVGGVDEKSSACASAFWNALGIETLKVRNARTAEMTKLADNLWIDLNIALANELALLCEKIGVDVLEVLHAANTLPKGEKNVNILFPGSGVGGSCLVKDPWFVYHLAKKYGLELKTPVMSRTINDSMPMHMFDLTMEGLGDAGKSIKGSKITVLGYAFSGSTNDTRSTPATEFIQLLKENGANVTVFDPWVNANELARLTGVKVAASLEEAMRGADCLAVVTGHPEFRKIDFSAKNGLSEKCTVVDGRHVFNPSGVISSGYIYKGVGRGGWTKQ